MRVYSKKYFSDSVITFMHILSNPNTSTTDYRNAFFHLGRILGDVLNKENQNNFGSTMLACTSEDTDWLAKGILETLSVQDISLAVFWNERIRIENSVEISPIIKTYIEPVTKCQSLILVKSIISTTCVVKTQLTHLINKITPEDIYIVAPVMYKGAEKSLMKEFPKEITNRFKFLTLATDDYRNAFGEVKPGIGGMIYPRLGLGDVHTKNSYIPDLVKERMGL